MGNGGLWGEVVCGERWCVESDGVCGVFETIFFFKITERKFVYKLLEMLIRGLHQYRFKKVGNV